jgi:hypothetical protein
MGAKRKKKIISTSDNESNTMSISNEFVESDVDYFKVPARNLRGGAVESREEPFFSASLSNFELGKQDVTE